MNTRLSAAKEKKQYLYAPSASGTATPSGTRSNGAAAHGDKRSFEGQVIRVWTGDQISILDKETNKERKVQLSSTRAPKSVTTFSMK
jgi:staphylococcal nuclease domain-containing protein 1